MATTELMSSHPFLCKRVAELQNMVHPGTVRPVPRTPLAYPLAPILGMTAPGSTSGVLLIFLYIGILVAIAIPNFMKKRDELLQMQSQQQQFQFPPPDEDPDARPDDDDEDEEADADPPVQGQRKTYRE